MGLRIKHGTSAQLNSPASIARYRAEKTLQYSKIQYRYVSLVSCWFVLANKSKPSRSCCHRLKSLTIYPRGETAKGPGFELSHWATVGNPETTVKLQALQTATSLSCIIWSHTLRRSWQMHRVATFRALGEAFSFFRSFTTAGCFRCIYQGHRRSVPVGECPWSVRRAPGVRAPQKVSVPLDTLSHCTDMHWESTHKLRVHSTVEIQDTHTLCNFKHIIYIYIYQYIYIYICIHSNLSTEILMPTPLIHCMWHVTSHPFWIWGTVRRSNRASCWGQYPKRRLTCLFGLEMDDKAQKQRGIDQKKSYMFMLYKFTANPTSHFE